MHGQRITPDLNFHRCVLCAAGKEGGAVNAQLGSQANGISLPITSIQYGAQVSCCDCLPAVCGFPPDSCTEATR